MTRFVVVPQWQGSPSSRAMTLIDGADTIAGDLPRSATRRIDVPVEAGETLDTGIRRFSALSRTHALILEALAEDAQNPALVVGGDCGVAVAGIASAAARTPDLAVVWFDAHADLNSPETSPSGAFGGMALRAVAEATAVGEASVTPDRIVLAGAREFDPGESEYLTASGIRSVSVDDLADPNELATAVAATGATAVYIHVDLDVLDPAVIGGVGMPVPFGLDVATLTAAIAVVRERVPLAGASLAGFAPTTPAAAADDMGTILRVIGALA